MGGPACFVLGLMLINVLYAEYHVRFARTSTGMTREDVYGGERIMAETSSYSTGMYGVHEIGNTRLSVRGYLFPGSSGQGGLVLYSPNLGPGWSGSGTAGRLVTTEIGIPGGALCTFGPISYQVIFGQLHIDGKAFDLLSGSQSIILDQTGRIISVHSIPPTTPPLPESEQLADLSGLR